MITKITTTLRNWASLALIFSGLFIVLIGGVIVKLGAWLGDRVVVSAPYPADDITDEELAQIMREAQEARSERED